MQSVTSRARRAALRRAGRAYLSGSTLPDALAVADAVRGQGHAATICYWSAESDTPVEVAGHCAAIVDAAAQRGPWCDLAVKTPALRFDPGLVGRLAEDSRDRDVRVWFDCHGPATAERTLRLAETSAAVGCEVGVALPARWLRSMDDAARAMGAGLAVRIVKGQYRDPEVSVDVHDVRARFLSLVDRLAAEVSFVALATHDECLLDRACTRLRGSGTPFEIQLLHGLPARRALEIADTYDVPVRFYAPFGHPALVYSLRTMWENRRLAGWLAQDLVLGGHKASRLARRGR